LGWCVGELVSFQAGDFVLTDGAIAVFSQFALTLNPSPVGLPCIHILEAIYKVGFSDPRGGE